MYVNIIIATCMIVVTTAIHAAGMGCNNTEVYQDLDDDTYFKGELACI
jgi:hypothetical protein